jgi:hypothetical protein
VVQGDPLELVDFGQKLREEPDLNGGQDSEAFRPKTEAASANDGLKMNVFFTIVALHLNAYDFQLFLGKNAFHFLKISLPESFRK